MTGRREYLLLPERKEVFGIRQPTHFLPLSPCHSTIWWVDMLCQIQCEPVRLDPPNVWEGERVEGYVQKRPYGVCVGA